MHIHILGICGTFMGSLAQLAVALGHQVTGQDLHVYPPMSDQLSMAGIALTQGYSSTDLPASPDLVVIGNAMSRGNPAVEAVLDRGLRYTSGPQFLADHVLPDRWVLGVAGTHGKTTTASMLAWILEYAGLQPGFLIGGVPGNFGTSARLGGSAFFVVEADEYDTAFFDKRSKFLHYRSRTLILNNLEFDHADIFADLAAIQQQFHHLVRTVPGTGQIILPEGETALDHVLSRGCWSELCRFGEGSDWGFRIEQPDASHWSVQARSRVLGSVRWSLTGLHNVRNGLAALLAARHAGVPLEIGIPALCQFAGVKRRMEMLAERDNVRLYDDFAHHPTAIATTLDGVRRQSEDAHVLAIIEPRSNTMRMGTLRENLNRSVASASSVIWYQPPGLDWSLQELVSSSPVPAQVMQSLDQVVAQVEALLRSRHGALNIIVMSNGGFGGLHDRLVKCLEQQQDNETTAGEQA